MEETRVVPDVKLLTESLGELPDPEVQPAFVVVSGLPGTGKSHFCRKLAERAPFLILESDVLRKVLFPSPTYGPDESSRLFRAIQQLIEDLLGKGIPLILDATNLSERYREYLYNIADRLNARLILVRVEAPSDVVRERLETRATAQKPEDKSDADWTVYQKMRPSVQQIRRNHYVVDTSRDITTALDKIARAVRK